MSASSAIPDEFWLGITSPAQMTKARTAAASKTRMAAGSEAPDFTLADASGRLVSLSNFRGSRPVVLIFGSFRCNLFCDQLGHLCELRDTYQGSAEFLFVYVSEAMHDSSPLANPSRPIPPPGIDVASRFRRVWWYEEELGTRLTWLLDGDDEKVEKLYDAWPRRLVIVGADGRVVFDAGHGLKDSWDLREIENRLKAAIAASQAPARSLHPTE